MSGMRFRIITLAGMLAAVALCWQTQLAWSHTVNQPGNTPEGLPDWGRVTGMLYRGGQPDLAGFKALKQMGVAIIVNFRDEAGDITFEQLEVESLGIKYVSIPWSGSSEPSNSQVVQFLDLVRANPLAKIFVHCKRGADRTGVMIAAYRIAVQHETAPEAVSEMHQYHYDKLMLPQLERYVKSLPELLRSNPLFKVYASMLSTPSVLNPAVPAVAIAARLAATGAIPAPIRQGSDNYCPNRTTSAFNRLQVKPSSCRDSAPQRARSLSHRKAA